MAASSAKLLTSATDWKQVETVIASLRAYSVDALLNEQSEMSVNPQLNLVLSFRIKANYRWINIKHTIFAGWVDLVIVIKPRSECSLKVQARNMTSIGPFH